VMRVNYDSPEPMTAAELRAVLALLERGLIDDGDRITPARLAELLGCLDHDRQPHGGPCQLCLPDPERADGRRPVASPDPELQ